MEHSILHAFVLKIICQTLSMSELITNDEELFDQLSYSKLLKLGQEHELSLLQNSVVFCIPKGIVIII